MNTRLTIGLLVLGFAARSEAATYYVSTYGQDGQTCAQAQSSDTPKGSITGGIGCLAAGDTLLVRGGMYNEAIYNLVPSGTSWDNKVRVAAYPGEVVWMSPQAGVGGGHVLAFAAAQSYIEFDGINLDASQLEYGPLKIETWAGANPHHIRVMNAELVGNPNQSQQGIIVIDAVAGSLGGDEFINLKIHGGGTNDFNHGMYLEASDIVVDNCDISDWSGAGIQIYNGYGVPQRNITIRNTMIHNLRATSSGQRHWGIIVGGAAADSRFDGNTIFNIPNDGGSSAGILIYQGSGMVIYNNALYEGPSTGIDLEPGSVNALVVNNTSCGHPAGDYIDYGTGTSAANNLFAAEASPASCAAMRALVDTGAQGSR